MQNKLEEGLLNGSQINCRVNRKPFEPLWRMKSERWSHATTNGELSNSEGISFERTTRAHYHPVLKECYTRMLHSVGVVVVYVWIILLQQVRWMLFWEPKCHLIRYIICSCTTLHWASSELSPLGWFAFDFRSMFFFECTKTFSQVPQRFDIVTAPFCDNIFQKQSNPLIHHTDALSFFYQNVSENKTTTTIGFESSAK